MPPGGAAARGRGPEDAAGAFFAERLFQGVTELLVVGLRGGGWRVVAASSRRSRDASEGALAAGMGGDEGVSLECPPGQPAGIAGNRESSAGPRRASR